MMEKYTQRPTAKINMTKWQNICSNWIIKACEYEKIKRTRTIHSENDELLSIVLTSCLFRCRLIEKSVC